MKVFVEEQRFKRWILLIVLVIPIVSGIIPIILAKNNTGTLDNESFWGLTITFIGIVLAFLFIWSMRLQTKIDEQGIYYQYFPIHLSQKFITWSDLKDCQVIKYNSLARFGGYGYRRSLFKNKGIAMNVGGKFGVQLILKNGKKILIGTQKEQEAIAVLETYQSKFKKQQNG